MSLLTLGTHDDDDGRYQLPLGLEAADVTCPICVETISDPFVTSCGHTFCYQCITTQLKHRRSCPSCSSFLTEDHIYPNFLLNKVCGCLSTQHARWRRLHTHSTLQHAGPMQTAGQVPQHVNVWSTCAAHAGPTSGSICELAAGRDHYRLAAACAVRPRHKRRAAPVGPQHRH